jgi:hypothetical protein
MAVFITLTTDLFVDSFNNAVNNAATTQRAGSNNARRPTRGLEIRDDTYAILKLVAASGNPIPLYDSSSSTGMSTDYTNFILQSVQEARMEKHQIVETFGEPYIYFFGESPRFLDVQAVLVDSNDFNWYAEFWQNYDQFFRGTRSVELGARTYLFYDDNIVEGYMLNAQARKTSDTPLMVQLQFRLYLTNYQNVTFVGSPNFPIRSSVDLPPSVNLTSADAFQVIAASTAGAGYSAQDLQDAIDLMAQQGAAQQLGQAPPGSEGYGSGGFGGASDLASVLAMGLSATGTASIDGVLADAAAALANAGTRTIPLRGLISDNTDEYTGAPDTPLALDPSDDIEEAPDFWATSIQNLAIYGADLDNPDSFVELGISANFGISVGVSIGAAAQSGPTFGVAGGVTVGGVNGGLGFTGVFASPILSAQTTLPTVSGQTYTTTAYGSSTPVFGNGVAINGGVISGTGSGGGIPGGLSGGIGPNGPGTLNEFVGGPSYGTSDGFASSLGYGANTSACGASINVGGSPSAFSIVVAPGVLVTTPADEDDDNFYIGPDGNTSDDNTTGVFVS